MLAVAALVGVAVAAVFAGLLYLGDNPRLPSYERLVRDREATPRLDDGGYDLPLYYPYVEPTPAQRTAADGPRLDLAAFAGAKPTDIGSGFRHWTIADYTARYRSRELSPVQVVRAVLAAVDASETGERPLRIFVEKHDDEILAQARASAARYARGEPLGVLDGVPVAVKDEMDVAGHRLFAGTSFLGDVTGVADADALPVARLRAQGAIILGKTNMHEAGSGVSGFNRTYGTPRNPYNTGHYPGGSSSGSTVAVASGIVPLAVGLDAGGSIRIPAGLCGVVGLKATFLRVPPIAADCPSLAHVGPITGSVRDAAIAYAAMSGGDASEPRSLSQPAVHLRGFDETASLRGLKVGYFRVYSDHSSPDIAAATQVAMHKLEVLGAELVAVELNFLQAIQFAHSMTVSTELVQHLDAFFSKYSELSPETQILLSFARHFTATDLLAAQRLRAFALRQLQENVFNNCDVFVTPTTAITAPEIPKDALAHGELDTRALGQIMRYSVYANFVGIPAMAVPIGYDAAGLPISLQVQSSHFTEDVMLRVAHAVEKQFAVEQRQPEAYYSIIDAAAQQPKE